MESTQRGFADWVRTRMGRWHRRSGYRFRGMDVLFLTTLGRRTGAPREAAVAWFADGADAWVIVASAAGKARHPAWYHNLCAHPDAVWIELRERKLKVVPTELHGPERQQRWQRITDAQPRYRKYQERTDRTIPVIRLTAS